MKNLNSLVGRLVMVMQMVVDFNILPSAMRKILAHTQIYTLFSFFNKNLILLLKKN